MIAAAFDEAGARDPGRLRTWVVLVLVDGAERQLALVRAEAAHQGVTIHVIIDIIHVPEYTWGAAWSLHAAGDPAAEDWVAVKALAVLAGDSERAAAEADAAGLEGSRALRGRRVRPLPGKQTRVPALRPSSGCRLADRDRRHRGRMPPSHSRPSRHRRSQVGPGWRRGSPHPESRHQQRRLSRSTGNSTSNASTNGSIPALSRDNTHSVPDRPAHFRRPAPNRGCRDG
jgi:hypothetical protein